MRSFLRVETVFAQLVENLRFLLNRLPMKCDEMIVNIALVVNSFFKEWRRLVLIGRIEYFDQIGFPIRIAKWLNGMGKEWMIIIKF